MAWDPSQPPTNAALLSAPVRGNFQALDDALMAALSAMFTGQVLYKGAGPVLAGVAPGASGAVLTLSGAMPAWAPAPGFPNPLTTLGDLLAGGASGAPTRLPVGAEAQVLTVSGGVPSWQPRVGFANPMTTVGDLIRGSAAGDPVRLPVGTNGHVLTVSGGVPTWAALPVTPGFANPMTAVGDVIVGGTGGLAQRLAQGTAGQVLMAGTTPTWTTPLWLTNPMTTAGDLIQAGASGVAQRLPIGSNTQVLTVVGGVPAWQTPVSGGMTNPMTTLGDLITGGAAGAAQRLGVGANTQVLTVVGGVPVWQAPVSGGMTNPMTAAGDLIIGGVAGAANRLAKGTDTQVLTLVAGLPAWAAPTGGGGGVTWPLLAPDGTAAAPSYSFAASPTTGLYHAANQILFAASGLLMLTIGTGGLYPGADNVYDIGSPTLQVRNLYLGGQLLVGGAPLNPMTTVGDLIRGAAGGVPERLPVGTTGQILTVVGGVPAWATSTALANPMLAVGDLIRGGASGAATRLAIGAEGHVLTVSSGVPAWTPAGFANPMTAPEDLIKGGVAGAAVRLPIGTNGQVLTVVGGALAWASGGVSFPILAPDGSGSAPSYSFSARPGAGLYRDGAGHLTLAAAGTDLLVLVRNNITAWWIDGNLGWQPGANGTQDLGGATSTLRNLFTLASTYKTGAAPATPAAGTVTTYAKTDKKMYSKDDAGVETPLGGGGGITMVPLPVDAARFADGTANNLFPRPMERVSQNAPTQTYIPKPVALVYSFSMTTLQHLIWRFVVPPDYAGGAVTLVTKWSTSVNAGYFRVLGHWYIHLDMSAGAGWEQLVVGNHSTDLLVPPTATMTMEVRQPLAGQTAVAGRMGFVSVATAAPLAQTPALTADVLLEMAWLEFAR